MEREIQFDMKHWIKSCKSSCELDLQTQYFCSYDQDYRDAIYNEIQGHPLSILDFSELVDWIPRNDEGLETMRKENEYGRDTPLKDLHTSLVENFTFRYIQLSKVDKNKQNEIKEYLKICASNEQTSKEVKLNLIDEIIKGDYGNREKLHPKVVIYLEDLSKVPGGANRKFKVKK
jgi:hypothetical protein